MQITFTDEELTRFAKELGDWHAQRAQIIINTMVQDPIGRRLEINRQEIDKWERDHPKPDWRSLL
jgi:transposase-like protein